MYSFENGKKFLKNISLTNLTPINDRCRYSFFRKKEPNKFGIFSAIKKPSTVSASLEIPQKIPKPPYHETSSPPQPPKCPEIKLPWQIQKMRDACKLAKTIMNFIGENIQIGMKHEDIDAIAHKKIIENDAYPSPLNYRGFPKSVCTSVNNVICHGIPDSRQLQNGDIVSVDITVFLSGYHGDCCETFLVGDVDESGRHLVNAAKKCRDAAIAVCAPDVLFNHIGEVVETTAKHENLTVIPACVGHGIGSYFHGPPDIYHSYNDYPGKMQPGMTFTIEPVLTQGKEDIVILEDGWTVVTLDDARAAQFEHTILITNDGHEILTE